MSTVQFDHVTCVYPGAERPSISDLCLDVPDGEFLVLVGPSGCGKSTTLRLLAGLEQATAGSIRIDGDDVTDVAPKDRDIAMVFQNYALYPHMTVAENMGFALRLAGVNRVDRERRVRRAAEMLDLVDLLDRRPRALSGGQRQRVAMGRAIVREPRVFLMDEPLSNLDARLRVQTRAEISRLTRELGVTTVYVTHDQTEAMTMGDRVAVLRDGELQQLASPVALYDAPVNAFVAGFIGSPAMSLIEVPARDGRPLLTDRPLTGPTAGPVPTAPARPGPSAGQPERGAAAGLSRSDASAGRLLIGVRPEDVSVVSAGEADARLVVRSVEVLGAEAFLYGEIVDDDRVTGWRHATGHEDGGEASPARLAVRVDGRRHPATGDVVPVRLDPARVHVFDPESGARMSRAA